LKLEHFIFGRLQRYLLIALVALASLISFWQLAPVDVGYAPARHGFVSSEIRPRDYQLYQEIAQRVAAGESYYEAAIALQHTRNYPVRPAWAVRLPTLAHVSAAIGGLFYPLLALLGLALLLWLRFLEERHLAERIGAGLLLLGGGLPAVTSHFREFHDVVAGLLLSIALALRLPAARLGLGIAAALVRELTIPFLIVQTALQSERRRTLLGIVLLLVFVALYAMHVVMVDGLVGPDERPAPPWNGQRGVAGFVLAMHMLTPLLLLPPWGVALVVFLPLLGWLELRHAGALLWFTGMIAAICLFARANNNYWVFNLLPAYLIGLAFVPAFVASTVRDLSPPRTPAL